MKTEQLLEIKAAILAHADQFQMSHTFKDSLDDDEDAGGCGTAACIAGWVMS